VAAQGALGWDKSRLPSLDNVSNSGGLSAAGRSGGFPTNSTASGFLGTSGETRIFSSAYFRADGMNGKGRACLTRQARRNNIVITMRAIHVSIRQIGNSQGVVIPKPVLAQLGLDSKAGAEMTIEEGALVLRRPASRARSGWA